MKVLRARKYDRVVKLRRYICRAEVNGWWPGKVVNLLMREEGRAMAQVADTSLGHLIEDDGDTHDYDRC